MHRNRSDFINFGAPTQNPASVFLWVVNLKFIQFDWFLPKYIFAAEQFPDRLVSTSIHFFDAETVKLLALLNIFVWDFLLLLDRFAPFYIYYYVQSSHGCVKQYVIFYLLTFKWRVDILTSLTSPPPLLHTHTSPLPTARPLTDFPTFFITQNKQEVDLLLFDLIFQGY